jgi:hypothetical protein
METILSETDRNMTPINSIRRYLQLHFSGVGWLVQLYCDCGFCSGDAGLTKNHPINAPKNIEVAALQVTIRYAELNDSAFAWIRGFHCKDADAPSSNRIQADFFAVLLLAAFSGTWNHSVNEWAPRTNSHRAVCPGPFFGGMVRSMKRSVLPIYSCYLSVQQDYLSAALGALKEVSPILHHLGS